MKISFIKNAVIYTSKHGHTKHNVTSKCLNKGIEKRIQIMQPMQESNKSPPTKEGCLNTIHS